MFREMTSIFVLCLFFVTTSSQRRFEDHRISKIEAILQHQTTLLQQQATQIKDLQTIVRKQQIEMNKQQTEISQLKTKIPESHGNPMLVKEHQTNIMNPVTALNVSQMTDDDMVDKASIKTDLGLKKETVPLNRDTRLLMGAITAPPPSIDVVAFYAVLSKNEAMPSTHHTLIFDTVKTNVGNCYNNFSGVFTTPVDGVYGLTYTMRVACPDQYASFEIVRNAAVQGEMHVRTGHCGGQTSSGTIVVVANKGDTIYVRTHPALHATGDIVSDSNGWSFFAGWLISPLRK